MQAKRQALEAQFGKDILLTQLHHVRAVAFAPKLALADAEPNPGFAVDEVNPQPQKTDVLILIQGADGERNTLRLRAFFGLLIKPFLDLFLRRQSRWIAVGKADELSITLPTSFCFGARLWLFECKADEFSAK